MSISTNDNIQTLSNKTITDDNCNIENIYDSTKLLSITLDSCQPNTTTTIYGPDINTGMPPYNCLIQLPPVTSDILVGKFETVTLFNKSLNTLNIPNPQTPSSSTQIANQGQITWDNNYIYVCIAGDGSTFGIWMRSTLLTF